VGIPGGMRWIALVLAVMAAGCGGAGHAAAPPRLPHALGSDLAAQASTIEASLTGGDACGAAAEAAQLQQMVASAVSSGQVPVALRGPLSRSSAALAAEITCVPAPPAKPTDGKPKPPGHDHGPGHGHGHGHDHGDNRGPGKHGGDD